MLVSVAQKQFPFGEGGDGFFTGPARPHGGLQPSGWGGAVWSWGWQGLHPHP